VLFKVTPIDEEGVDESVQIVRRDACVDRELEALAAPVASNLLQYLLVDLVCGLGLRVSCSQGLVFSFTFLFAVFQILLHCPHACVLAQTFWRVRCLFLARVHRCGQGIME
jgi:hypothetical protein